MTHDEVQELLEQFVDERLDRQTRRAVEEHLDGCAECSAILDATVPVDLSALEQRNWDPTSMRRAVRRSLLQTAAGAAGLLVIGWLVLSLVSALALQPLVVDRGGRSGAAVRATADLAVMLNPGATVESWSFDAGFLDRTVEVVVVQPTGAGVTPLGTVTSRVTVSDFAIDGFGPGSAMLVRQFGGQADVARQLERIGDGTVARIEIHFASPITVAEADALVASSGADVRIVWAGFATERTDAPVGLGVGGVIGYSTCDLPPLDVEIGSAGSGSGSRSVFGMPPSVERARVSTVAALENLADHGGLLSGADGWNEASVRRAAEQIDSAGLVETLVVTGPTTELRRFVDAAQPDFGAVRDVDFYNWFEPLCGS